MHPDHNQSTRSSEKFQKIQYLCVIKASKLIQLLFNTANDSQVICLSTSW